MTAKVIALANQKGGVGKSTLTVLLGGELPIMSKGKRVLIVDTDTQHSVKDVMIEEDELKPFACEWLDCTMYGEDAKGIIAEIVDVIEEYDYIIMDLRGKLEGNGVNEEIMKLVDLIITPVQPNAFAIKSTTNTIKYYIEQLTPMLTDAGLEVPEMRLVWLLPQPSKIRSLDREIIEQFDKDTKDWGIKQFNQKIHHYAEIEEAVAVSLPVSSVKSGGAGTKAIRILCKEIMDFFTKK